MKKTKSPKASQSPKSLRRLSSIINPKSLIAVSAIAIVGVILLVATRAATGPATLSISPSSGSRVKDSTFSVGFYVDSKGQDINAFTFKLSYDQSKLQPTSDRVDFSMSQFSGCAERSAGGGVVKLTCFITGEVINTRQQVGAVTFKVIAGSGSSAFAFGGDSQISQAGSGTNIWDGVTAAGSFSFTTPTPTTPTTPVTPTTPTSPSTPKPSTPKTSTPSAPSSGSSGGSGASGGSSAAPVVTNPDTNSTQPQITGIVAVSLVDPEGRPAGGVTVKLGKLEAVTDANGVASFIGVAPGKHKLSANSKVLGAISKEIQVGAAANQAQEFNLQLKKRPNFLLYAMIILLVMAIITAVLFLRRWMRQRAEHNRHFTHARNAVMVGGQQPPEQPDEPIAALVTPHSDAEDEAIEKEALEKLKPSVSGSDTLEEIERKVGAKKTPPTEAASNDFEPNLIIPKKSTPTKLQD